MIAAILTNLPSRYAVRQLADVGQLRGHEMFVVDYRFCFSNAFGQDPDSTPVVDLFAACAANSRSELNVRERCLAECAENALYVEIADVTLLRSNDEPLVLDANPFPKLEW